MLPPALPPRPSVVVGTNPPPLPPRSSVIHVPVPPPLPPRPSAVVGTNPPPLPPRTSVVALPNPVSRSSSRTPAPVNVPVVQPTSVCGYYKLAKEKYKSLFLEEKYVTNDHECLHPKYVPYEITGKKGTNLLYVSIFFSIFVAMMPVFTGDTTIYTWSTDEDGNKTCSESSGSLWYVFFLLALVDYPWVLLMRWKTGLWFNPSGIHIQVDSIREELFEDIADIPYFGCVLEAIFRFEGIILFIVEFFIMFFSATSSCGGNIQNVRLIFLYIVLGCMAISLCSVAYFSKVPIRVQNRVKILTWAEITRDTLLNIIAYCGIYGYGGVVFIIFPLIGYAETFGFFG